jgi:predicted dehydrogenase
VDAEQTGKPSLSLSTVYKVTPKIDLKLAWSRSFGLPALENGTSGLVSSSGQFQINENVPIAADGTVGTINSCQAKWIRRAGIPGFGGWFTTKALSGGGPLIDLLHMVDLGMHFMGYPEPAHVLARTYKDHISNKAFKGPWGIPDVAKGTTDVEAAAHGFVTFKTGQSMSFAVSWAEMNQREEVSVTFQGTKAGGLVRRLFGTDGLDNTAIDTCQLYTLENGRHVNRDIIVPADETMGRVRSAANFVRSIEGTEKPLNTPAQALSLMKLIDGAYQSAATGKPVAL